MKSNSLSKISVALAVSLVFSCASTPKTAGESSEKPAEIQAVSPSVPKEPSKSEQYAQKVSSARISLLSSPRETSKTKPFASPYILKAEDADGKAVDSFAISVMYPSKRESGEVIFSEAEITTNSEGKAEFLPPAPEYSFNSEISFFPNYEREGLDETEKAEIEKIASEHTVTAPFKVQTNLKAAGGVIALVDFNQSGKAVTSNPVSSSKLLMTLMKAGFTGIGNAPEEITNAVIRNDEARLFSRGKAFAKNFLIYGTVKIDSSEKTDAGISYTLTAVLKAMSMKTGEITFKSEKTVTVTDKNDWNALDKARTTLANEIADEIKYGI